MISCIICSRAADISAELSQNILSTVGCDCEIVVIDNHDNRYSIFSAYNEGVRRAKGDILCFMHDDIILHTQDWGKVITTHFEDESIGLIGFAGAHFLPSYPTYWWSSPFVSQYNIDHEHGRPTEQFSVHFF
jgi:Glycosyl transferase family 2.